MIWKIVTDFCLIASLYFFCLCIINKYVGQFVSQTPWIQAATLRDNVLFGSDFDAQRWKKGPLPYWACYTYIHIPDTLPVDIILIGLSKMADPVCLEICLLCRKYGHFVWSVVSNSTKLQCWRICTEKNHILGFMRRCRYEEVIKACALDVDIQGMQGNDLAEIGEQGSNLSGGQRARLALARYLTLENFLLFLSEVLHWKLLLRRRLFNED